MEKSTFAEPSRLSTPFTDFRVPREADVNGAREEQLQIFAQLAERNPLWSHRRCIDRAYIELMKQQSVVRPFFSIA